jgi:hypothetical protein
MEFQTFQQTSGKLQTFSLVVTMFDKLASSQFALQHTTNLLKLRQGQGQFALVLQAALPTSPFTVFLMSQFLHLCHICSHSNAFLH